MAIAASEIKSLDEIQYPTKIRIFFLILLVFFLFGIGFVNFFPLGDKVKTLIKTQFKGTSGCNPDFDEIHMEWIMPKIVVSGLSVPASCLDRSGPPLKFSFVTLNWHLINFAPFGLPFRLDTEFSGQALSLYYVIGIGEQLIRLKDQNLVLSRFESILGDKVKLSGAMVTDLNLSMKDGIIQTLDFKAQSKDFQIPSQNIQGFTLPSLKLNEFYLEASSDGHPKITIDKLIIGDPDAPVRANFKGRIELQSGNIGFSPLDLSGEVAFSENFKQTLPLIDMMFQSFAQKDGFYQVRLGGTLGAPTPSAL